MPAAAGTISPGVPYQFVLERGLDEESPHHHVARDALAMAVAVIAFVVCFAGIVAAATAPLSNTRVEGASKAVAERATVSAADTAPPVLAEPATPAAPATAPAPVEPPVVEPAPAEPTPAPSPPPEPPSDTSLGRALSALVQSVPAEWLAAVPVDLELGPGNVSYAYPTGVIEISHGHSISRWSTLVLVATHEFGHQLAYRYGTQAYFGAAPEGWPYAGAAPEERWADCVAIVFTGPNQYASCPDEALAWTANWLAAGPSAHPVTG